MHNLCELNIPRCEAMFVTPWSEHSDGLFFFIVIFVRNSIGLESTPEDMCLFASRLFHKLLIHAKQVKHFKFFAAYQRVIVGHFSTTKSTERTARGRMAETRTVLT
eukprot:IDg19357t1